VSLESVWALRRRKKSLPPTRIRTPDYPACNLVTVTDWTELKQHVMTDDGIKIAVRLTADAVTALCLRSRRSFVWMYSGFFPASTNTKPSTSEARCRRQIAALFKIIHVSVKHTNFIHKIMFTATCFDSKESSSGYPQKRT
jgi:hypothetical protein